MGPPRPPGPALLPPLVLALAGVARGTFTVAAWPRVAVVAFGGSVSVNCSRSPCPGGEATLGLETPLEATAGPGGLRWQSFVLANVSQWSPGPVTCSGRCGHAEANASVGVLVYQLPRRVFLEPVAPVAVGDSRNVTCRVLGVAPVGNLTVTLRRGAETLRTQSFGPAEGEVSVAVSHELTAARGDHGQPVTCHAELSLRPHGPLFARAAAPVELSVFALPEPPELLAPATIEAGTVATVTCRVTGAFPAASVRLSAALERQPLNLSVPELSGDTVSASAPLRPPLPGPRELRCTAAVATAARTARRQLHVYRLPEPRLELSPAAAAAGSEVTVTCSSGAAAEPPRERLQLRDGATGAVLAEGPRPRLRLRLLARRGDHGRELRCRASLALGQRHRASKEAAARMAVLYLPEIPAGGCPSKRTWVRGSLEALSCLATGNPEPTVVCARRGVPVATGQPRPVTRARAGTYVCNATNALGTRSRRVTVRVEYEPTLSESGCPARRVWVEGQRRQLECRADGDPAPSTRCDRDGDSRDGDSRDGDSQNGDTWHGDIQHGDSWHGDSQDSDTWHGDIQDGDSQDGDSRDGDIQHGDSRDSDTWHGDTQHGDTRHDDHWDSVAWHGDIQDGGSRDGDSQNGDTWHGDNWHGDTRHSDSWDGDSRDGDAWHGDIQDGDSRDGDIQHGDTWHGDSWDGDTRHGDSWDGDSRDGDAWHGDIQDGDSRDGDIQHGDTWHGDSWDSDSRDGDAWHGDIQHGDTRHSDTRDGDIQHSGTRHGDTQDDDTRDSDTRHGDTQDSDTRHGDTHDRNTQHGDTQHGDIQHGDTQDDDTQHSDTQSGDTQHGDTWDSDTRHGDTRHSDTQDDDTQRGDTQNGDTQHGDTRDSDTRHGDTRDGDTQHGDTRDSDTRHGDTRDGDTQHGDTQHGDTQHGDTRHSDTQHRVVTRADGGRYVCRATNRHGVAERSVLVTVEYRPSIGERGCPERRRWLEGTRAELGCAATGNPPPRVTCAKLGDSGDNATGERGDNREHPREHPRDGPGATEPGGSGDNATGERGDNRDHPRDHPREHPRATRNATTEPGDNRDPLGSPARVTRAHAGTYECRATNAHGWATRRVTVAVEYGPSGVTVRVLPSANVTRGGGFTVDCGAEGVPVPTYSWALPPAPNLRLAADNRSVTVTGATAANRGVYTCTASNRHGRRAASVVVRVDESRLAALAALGALGAVAALAAAVAGARYVRATACRKGEYNVRDAEGSAAAARLHRQRPEGCAIPLAAP